MLSALIFAGSITVPIFCVLGLGVQFRRIGWITDEFAAIGSKLVFQVSLPCLLFVKLVETDFRHNLPWLLVVYAVLATIASFLLLERFAKVRLPRQEERGVFVQGAFRSNMGIIGLAFCISAFGDQIIAPASIYLALLTTLFNILAVITLTRHRTSGKNTASWRNVFLNILKNPLIIAIALGVVISLSRFPLPNMLLTIGGYFAQMTLPLALLCAGASIRLHELSNAGALYQAVTAKLLLVPLGITCGAVLIGLRGEALGVLYLMSSAPTAAASYPMTRALGGNHHLAAAIIAVTTLGSLLSTTLGVFLLRQSGLI